MHRKHFLQKMSLAIVTAAVLFTAAAASSGPTAAINQPMFFAQAGSTGGTIGKQDKSASGGEEKLRPHRTRKQVLRPHHAGEQVLRASKPERQSKRMPGKSPATPRVSVGGQWNWYATCAFGNWGGVITLVKTTASTFHGSFGGQGPADNGIITDGTIRGKHLSCLRRVHVGESAYERIDADLVSMEPPTLEGHVVDPATGACQFVATKM